MFRGMIAVIAFVALTVVCWGIYGPVIHLGQHAMQGRTSLRPFMCVGAAYFVIAVVVPVLLLRARGEVGQWTVGGTIWSLGAGAAGAIGALGIILAFANKGNAVYVMPLVFGGAPVINTFVTMFLSRSYKQASPIFFAGLILVVAGAVTVLFFGPSRGPATAVSVSLSEMLMIAGSIITTVICWGLYGPALHKGQMKMAGSRLRPFICVGLAYFAVAVIVPGMLLGAMETDASFTFTGSLWSLAGGAVGAVGALGIIMAFNFGGKPILVMPLVFGGAPIVNTFYSLSQSNNPDPISSLFYAGLIAVIAGAVTVLLFAPKSPPKPATPSPQAGGSKADEPAAGSSTTGPAERPLSSKPQDE